MKLIATPNGLKFVDVPLKANPNQFAMVEAAMQLAMEVPVQVVGDTIVVDTKRSYASLLRFGGVSDDNA